MRTSLLLVIMLVLLYSAGMAQAPNCPQTLKLAQSTYEQGRLHEVPTILEGCLKNGFTTQEKEAAYKLLTLTYLYLEEPEKAEDAMLQLLRTNPYFEPKAASDPAEFLALYRTYRTRPIYRIGMGVGVNATQPNVVSTLHTVAGSNSDFKYKIGFQFSVVGDVPLNDNLTLTANVSYQAKTFELKSVNDRTNDFTNTLTATEKQNWLSVPIAIQYRLKPGKYNPYVSLGVATDMLLNASLQAERLREAQTSVEPKTFDISAQRNKLNLSTLLAVGSKIRVGGGYLVMEARYQYGLTKVNSEKTAYDNQDMYLSYGLPQTIFKLNSLFINAAYVQNIFNPKKLTKKR